MKLLLTSGGVTNATIRETLVELLGVGPVVSYGSSGGGQITLDLVLRHPSLLRGAIVHEPPLFSVSPEMEEVGAAMLAGAQQGMAEHGARATMEGFALQMFGEDSWPRYDAALRERILANAERFFTVGMPGVRKQVVDPAMLKASRVPVVPMIGRDNRESFFAVISAWIGEQVGAALTERIYPGLGHIIVSDELQNVGRMIDAVATSKRVTAKG